MTAPPRDTTPLLELSSSDIEPTSNIPALLADARRELEHLAHVRADAASATWGYFPDYTDPDDSAYAACQALEDALNTVLPLDEMRLAFLRVALREPKSEFGGLHIDVHDGVGHERPAHIDEDAEIVRALVNLGDHPRRLAYLPGGRDELGAIDRHRYAVLNVDPARLRHIDIPPFDGKTIWMLRFWSSVIPHAGVTDDRGHFLAAYGAYFGVKP